MGHYTEGSVNTRNSANIRDIPTAEFKREERYIVIKRKKLSFAQEVKLRDFLRDNGIGTIESVVVEDDWPENEIVWKMIEDRCKS